MTSRLLTLQDLQRLEEAYEEDPSVGDFSQVARALRQEWKLRQDLLHWLAQRADMHLECAQAATDHFSSGDERAKMGVYHKVIEKINKL